jgi:hypothetical protein
MARLKDQLLYLAPSARGARMSAVRAVEVVIAEANRFVDQLKPVGRRDLAESISFQFGLMDATDILSREIHVLRETCRWAQVGIPPLELKDRKSLAKACEHTLGAIQAHLKQIPIVYQSISTPRPSDMLCCVKRLKDLLVVAKYFSLGLRDRGGKLEELKTELVSLQRLVDEYQVKIHRIDDQIWPEYFASLGGDELSETLEKYARLLNASNFYYHTIQAFAIKANLDFAMAQAMWKSERTIASAGARQSGRSNDRLSRSNFS